MHSTNGKTTSTITVTALQNSESDMTVLVTGGAGFIGSAFVRYLLEKTEVKVVNIDKLTYAANLQALEEFGAKDRHFHFQDDICDEAAILKILEDTKPNIVVHLAAESHVDRSIEGPAAFVETNILGTYSLLEAISHFEKKYELSNQQPLRFIHVSTDEVYGSLGDTGRFTEDSAYRPNSPYAATKAASDHLARAWHNTYGLETIVTNASNNYGPYQFPEKLIPRTIISALCGKPIEIYGTGINIRDWIHVNDHADALWCIALNGISGLTYNIGANTESRNVDLVRMLCKTLNELSPATAPHERHITFVDDRPGHDFRYALDASRLQTSLKWRPSYTLADGIHHTVAWYLENRSWWQKILETTYDGSRLGRIQP